LLPPLLGDGTAASAGTDRNGIIPLLIDAELTKLLWAEGPAGKARGFSIEDIGGRRRAERKPVMCASVLPKFGDHLPLDNRDVTPLQYFSRKEFLA
jgi:hypothetical protein